MWTVAARSYIEILQITFGEHALALIRSHLLISIMGIGNTGKINPQHCRFLVT
jgi:hypothetical protein